MREIRSEMIRALSRNKIYLCFLALLLVAISFAAIFFAGHNSAYAEADLGSAENPVILDSAEDIIALAEAIENGIGFDDGAGQVLSAADTPAADYSLTQTITLATDSTFKGIGTKIRPFRGVFDGNNKVVNLTGSSSRTESFGLFAYVSGNGSRPAVIKRVVTERVVYHENAEAVGGIIGSVTGGSVELLNCSSNLNITGGVIVGGLIGKQSGGYVTVSECRYTGLINGAGYMGGIVGYAGGETSARVLLKITNITGAKTIDGAEMKYLTEGVGFIGLAAGGFGSARAGSEIALIENIFDAKSTMTAAWNNVRIVGEIDAGLTVNVINMSVRRAGSNQNLSAYHDGSGNFQYITPASAYSVSLGEKDLPHKGDITEKVYSKISVTKSVASSVYFLTYGEAGNLYAETSEVYYDTDNDSGVTEHKRIMAKETGSLSGMSVFVRLSGFTYVKRNLNLSLTLQKPAINPKDTIKYGVDTPTEYDLRAHFDVTESAYEEDMSFTYRVVAAVGGKLKPVEVYAVGGLYQYCSMRAGSYTVYISIFVPDVENSGELRNLFPGQEFSFSMLLYNSDGQIYVPPVINPGDSGLTGGQIALIVGLSVGIPAFICVVILAVLFICKRNKRKKADSGSN